MRCPWTWAGPPPAAPAMARARANGTGRRSRTLRGRRRATPSRGSRIPRSLCDPQRLSRWTHEARPAVAAGALRAARPPAWGTTRLMGTAPTPEVAAAAAAAAAAAPPTPPTSSTAAASPAPHRTPDEASAAAQQLHGSVACSWDGSRYAEGSWACSAHRAGPSATPRAGLSTPRNSAATPCVPPATGRRRRPGCPRCRSRCSPGPTRARLAGRARDSALSAPTAPRCRA
mmetsp:Transcript_55171/g.159772  ORF Transcript_55171/g.159772 Transcript_55171/m.159772 type:complete len:230 (-) Transcript_55171:244-933(-)